MNKFVIRNNERFVRYVRYAWRYFLKGKAEGIKIIIRENDVFIHIEQAYSVILNDLEFIRNNPDKYTLEASKSSLNWLSLFR